MSETYQSFIAGKWVDAESGASYENRNPADTHDVIGTFPACGPPDVDRAVASALRGFQQWSRVPAPSGARCSRRLATS